MSCGYLFTVVLASDGMVFSCGVGGAGGHPDGENRYTATAIDALRFVPVSYLATGYSHAVAITVTGQVWAWGQNSQGQLGVEDPAEVQVRLNPFSYRVRWEVGGPYGPDQVEMGRWVEGEKGREGESCEVGLGFKPWGHETQRADSA